MLRTNLLALPAPFKADEEDSDVLALIVKAEKYHTDLQTKINHAFVRLQQLDPMPELRFRSRLEELNLLNHDLKERGLDFVAKAENLDQKPLRLDKTQPHELKKKCKEYYKRLANILHTDKKTGNREAFDKAKLLYDNLDLDGLQYMYYNLVNKNNTSVFLKELTASAYRKLQTIRALIDSIHRSSHYSVYLDFESNNITQALDKYRTLINLNVLELDQKIAKIQFILSQSKSES